jgi:RNA polymerase sigma-70 factor (ECF subfamily)
MAEPLSEFDSLLERARTGDQDAARELYERYSGPVRAVVRRALHQRMRSQYDSMDFVQSVWAAFFLVPEEGPSFACPEDLVKFLSCIAYNKVVDKARQRLGTQKHDETRVSSLEEVYGNEAPLAEAVPMRTPTPSQEAMATERWESMLAGQPPEFQRALEMLRLGHRQSEVAAVLGIHPKHLQRVLQQLRIKVAPS